MASRRMYTRKQLEDIAIVLMRERFKLNGWEELDPNDYLTTLRKATDILGQEWLTNYTIDLLNNTALSVDDIVIQIRQTA